jgi:dipeptidyl aminopeptidase/acylaminoacyl peptidase
MTRSRFLAAAGAAALLLIAPAAGAERRPFRFDEMVKAGRLSGFSLSRDGKWIAYAVSVPDLDENRGRSAIWLVAAAGGEPRRLTGGPRDGDPKFSPNGKKLAFVSNREGGSQIWLLDLAGGDPVKATSFPTEVSGYEWSPDGKWFVVTSDVFPECADAACLDKKLKAREKSKIRARIAEGLLFRHWDSWKDGTRTHV